MIYAFDIDGTLCSGEDSDYPTHRPHIFRIKYVNFLYELGHTIILFTARGTTSGKDWRKETEEQLEEWGVKYHQLIFGKPHFDFLIDDKAINPERFFNEK